MTYCTEILFKSGYYFAEPCVRGRLLLNLSKVATKREQVIEQILDIKY